MDPEVFFHPKTQSLMIMYDIIEVISICIVIHISMFHNTPVFQQANWLVGRGGGEVYSVFQMREIVIKE